MKISIVLPLMIFNSIALFAQDDLMKLLEAELKEEPSEIIQTFDGSRVVNGHAAKALSKGELEFLIMHRFGRINSGAYNLFGLDQAFIRLGFEYGITDNMSIGLGRSSFDKSYDFYFKDKLISQRKNVSPVTVTLFSSLAINSSQRKIDFPDITFNDRLAFTNQLLIARKFNSKLSLQLMPVFVHTNVVDQDSEFNSLFALGFAGRYKLTKSLALTAEYYNRLNVKQNSVYNNPVAIGIDIETGGHVFQIHVTNAFGMIERAIIAETTGHFFRGDFNLGFNISRSFQLNKQKRSKSW
jgi:hypothetical protein